MVDGSAFVSDQNTYAALASAGITALTLNIRFHPEELAHCLSAGAPRAVITSAACAPLLEYARSRPSPVTTWACLDEPPEGYTRYQDLLGGPPASPAEVRGEDIHNVLYTSGTTGRAKGAMISQAAAAIRGLRLAQWFGLREQDGFIGWLPLFHCGGDESLYATMLTGGTYGTLRKADAETMYRMIERDRLRASGHDRAWLGRLSALGITRWTSCTSPGTTGRSSKAPFSPQMQHLSLGRNQSGPPPRSCRSARSFR